MDNTLEYPGSTKHLLWPDGQAPLGDGSFEKSEVSITVHPAQNPNGAAVIICPGGGYGMLVMGAEGHGIAQWLNKHGITGVVLEYRLPHGNHFRPLLDVQRALRLTRNHADAWKIDPNRIGIVGFSAGGHLASTAGTHFNEGTATDPGSCRPDFMILIYPVISLDEKVHQGTKNNLLGSSPTPELTTLFSNEKQVTTKTPPAFLAHAIDDTTVLPENSEMFRDALIAHGVQAEYLPLPFGGHGLNKYQGPSWDAWQSGSLVWLAKLGFIPAENITPSS